MFVNVMCKHTRISQLGLLHKKDFTANMYVFPLVTEQHVKCSNRALCSPEDGHNDA